MQDVADRTRAVVALGAPPPVAAAPKGLAAIASEGAINLIWETNTEKDLDGYIVLRAIAPSDALQPITPAPIKETAMRDGVQAGRQYIYAVRAVDKASEAERDILLADLLCAAWPTPCSQRQ